LKTDQPFASVRVVLPDRLQTAAFRRRLAEAGGSLCVQVGTFGDLYRDILRCAGLSIPVASPPIVHRLVQSALEQVHSAGQLQHYAGLRETPGFALALRDSFAELKRALVLPEHFIGWAVRSGSAEQELARLYQTYQTQLQTLGWADPEGLSWLAVQALQDNLNPPIQLDLLVVDGFDSFAGAQLQALKLLEPIAVSILATLPGVLPFERAAHRRFSEAYQALAANLPLVVRDLNRQVFLPVPLHYLEANLFKTGAGRASPGEHLSMIEARTPAEEAREALRWLKARVVRDGVSLQTCAVVTPDPDCYHPYLRQAAAEMGIPLRFTQGEALVQSPAIAALLGLLNLPALNYPRRLVLDALRSPYFDLAACGLDHRSVDILDDASRYGQVIEGRDQWEETFHRLAQKATPPVLEEEDELRVPNPPFGEQVAPLQLALRCFFDRLSPPATSGSLIDWVRWLEDLLDEWCYYEPESGMRDQAAYEALRQTLHALVVSEAITGPQSFDYAQFLTELQGALRGSGYQEPLPGAQSAALVMRMIEARGVRFQAVAILGLSEGVFPVLERPDPFLDEQLRKALGLESRLQREQPGLFYQAATRADRFLLLTRPYLADDGERWEASPYWKAVLALLPEHAENTIRPDDTRSLNDAASPEEALFWAVRRRSLPQGFADLLPRWQYLRHARDLLRSRQADQAAGPYEGHPQLLESQMQASYGEHHVWSASRLEAYGACPFQFFVSSALDLQAKAEPVLGLNAAQLGTILHKILQRAYAEADNPGDPNAVRAVLPEIARQEFERAPLEQGFRPSLLWQVDQELLLQKLEAAVDGLAGQDPAAGWQPVAFEQDFGFENNPLAVGVDGQTILLHGVVDRIDRDTTGRLRIVDYKTGSSHQGNQDLIQGRRLQLPLYALASQSALGFGEVKEGLYWSLLKGEAGPLKLSTFKRSEERGLQVAVDVALEHLGRIVHGIRQAQFPPVPPKGGCSEYCPASAWCWRYKPGW
jgi:ATP-dependent helicase/DNAse subunit B